MFLFHFFMHFIAVRTSVLLQMNNRFTNTTNFKHPLRVRKRAKQYTSGPRRASHCMSIYEGIQAEGWIQIILVQLTLLVTMAPGAARRRSRNIVGMMYQILLRMLCERNVFTGVLPRFGVCIASLPDDVQTTYRFRTKDHLVRLITALRIPLVCKLSNGSVFNGEELFLFFLRRLCCLKTINDLVVDEFGGDPSAWARGFNWMAKWICSTWHHKLTNNFAYWAPSFATFAEKIRVYVNHKCTVPPPGYWVATTQVFLTGLFLVVAFIDCNLTYSSRPGGGPQANGHRGNYWLQRAFYTGWLKIHGFKHQSIDLPNGLTMSCWGPASVRQNDVWCLTQSGILAAFAIAVTALNLAVTFVLYGDAIYPNGPYLRRRTNFQPPAREATIDWAFSSARETVEHHYGEADMLFPYFKVKHRVKLCSSANIVKELYIIRLLLRNCYVCLYHNKTSQRFDCAPPEMEHYMV